MNGDLHDLEARLTHLEKSNRRLRLVSCAILVGGVVIVASGQARPAAESVPAELTAQKFRLVDHDGKTRAELRTQKLPTGALGSELALLDEEGRSLASLTAFPEQSNLNLNGFSERGSTSVLLTANPGTIVPCCCFRAGRRAISPWSSSPRLQRAFSYRSMTRKAKCCLPNPRPLRSKPRLTKP